MMLMYYVAQCTVKYPLFINNQHLWSIAKIPCKINCFIYKYCSQ